MKLRVKRWGNSLAVRLAASVINEARPRAGDKVEIGVDRDRLVVRRPCTADEVPVDPAGRIPDAD